MGLCTWACSEVAMRRGHELLFAGMLIASGCAPSAGPQLEPLGQDLQCKTVYRDQYHGTDTACGTTSCSSICGPTSASMMRQTMTCGECAPTPGDVRRWYSTYAGLPVDSCCGSKATAPCTCTCSSGYCAQGSPTTLAQTMEQVGIGKQFDDGCPAGTVVDHCVRSSAYTIADLQRDLSPDNGYVAVVSGDMSQVYNHCCDCKSATSPFNHTIFVRAYDLTADKFEVYDPDATCNHKPQPHPSYWTAAEMSAFSNNWQTNVSGLCVLLGKGIQAGPGADCSTLAAPPVPVSTDPADGLDFACGNSMRDWEPDAGWVDWDYGFYKADCSDSQAATGISIGATSPSYPRDLLCRLDDAARYQHKSCHSVLLFAAGAPDAGSRECADTEYVAAASQTTGLKLHAILCCTGQVQHTNCAAVAINGDQSREGAAPAGWKDWDPGNSKVECGAGRFVAGISQQDGVPQSILCCGDPVAVAGEDAGSPAVADAATATPGADATIAAADGGAPHTSDAGTGPVDAGCACGSATGGKLADAALLLLGLGLLRARRRALSGGC